MQAPPCPPSAGPRVGDTRALAGRHRTFDLAVPRTGAALSTPRPRSGIGSGRRLGRNRRRLEEGAVLATRSAVSARITTGAGISVGVRRGSPAGRPRQEQRVTRARQKPVPQHPPLPHCALMRGSRPPGESPAMRGSRAPKHRSRPPANGSAAIGSCCARRGGGGCEAGESVFGSPLAVG